MNQRTIIHDYYKRNHLNTKCVLWISKPRASFFEHPCSSRGRSCWSPRRRRRTRFRPFRSQPPLPPTRWATNPSFFFPLLKGNESVLRCGEWWRRGGLLSSQLSPMNCLVRHKLEAWIFRLISCLTFWYIAHSFGKKNHRQLCC